ncbi:MAG: hypothetical protein KGZ43_11285, partial [Sulfuritalea sp.]|nr:hypothetical protein [Sulfuritalea sp.]
AQRCEANHLEVIVSERDHETGEFSGKMRLVERLFTSAAANDTTEGAHPTDGMGRTSVLPG